MKDHIPAAYTAKAGADAKTRHRMVGAYQALRPLPRRAGMAPRPEPQVLGEGLTRNAIEQPRLDAAFVGGLAGTGAGFGGCP